MKSFQFAIIFAALAASVAFTGNFSANAQDVGKLYAPRPPEGSAFVRLVSALPEPVSLTIGSLDAVKLSANAENAMDFRLMRGGEAVELVIDGKPLDEKVDVAADSFVTVLLWNDKGATKMTAVTDSTRGHDDLKAELRVYNLVPECAGVVAIANGPAVFSDVATGASQKRSINPVSAELVVQCAANASQPVALPQLKAGDRFSLFISGQADAPVLSGRIDRTQMPGQ